MEETKYFINKIKSSSYLKLAFNPQSNIICFYFYCTNFNKSTICVYTKKIRDIMYKNGTLMAGCHKIKNSVDFFRVPINSHELTHDIIDNIIRTIEKTGRTLMSTRGEEGGNRTATTSSLCHTMQDIGSR